MEIPEKTHYSSQYLFFLSITYIYLGLYNLNNTSWGQDQIQPISTTTAYKIININVWLVSDSIAFMIDLCDKSGKIIEVF